MPTKALPTMEQHLHDAEKSYQAEEELIVDTRCARQGAKAEVMLFARGGYRSAQAARRQRTSAECQGATT